VCVALIVVMTDIALLCSSNKMQWRATLVWRAESAVTVDEGKAEIHFVHCAALASDERDDDDEDASKSEALKLTAASTGVAANVVMACRVGIAQAQHRRVFGVPLDSSNSATRAFELLCDDIAARGVSVEGIFRISAAASEVRELRLAIETNLQSCDLSRYSVHAVGNVLKAFLRELVIARLVSVRA
jgi:hypothetical protein